MNLHPVIAERVSNLEYHLWTLQEELSATLPNERALKNTLRKEIAIYKGHITRLKNKYRKR